MRPSTRTWLILNPTAGRGDEARGVLEAALELGLNLEVHETRCPGDGARLARQAVEQGMEVLIVAGGDGTLSEAVNGIAPDFAALRLLIVPLGTGNDFARTLNLPWQANQALALLDTGRTLAVDLLHVHRQNEQAGEQHRYLLNAATGGISEHIHQQLDPEAKRRWGPLAYLRAAAGAVSQMEAYDLTLRLDDEPMSLPCWSLVVANGRFTGGGFEFAPQANLEDRQIDVVAVTGEPGFDWLKAASRYAMGAELQGPGLLVRQAHTLEVDAQPAMAFSSDGELVGRTPASFSILPRALRVIVPGP